jgi:ferric iron reductase protein FhuF
MGFPLLPGPLAPLVESLVPLPDAGALPARLFQDADGAGTLLAAMRHQRPGADPRALASLWSRWYFAKLIPPVLLCGLLARRDLPLRPEQTGVVLGADGLPRAIALPGAGEEVAGDDPFVRFAPLVQGHVAEVVRCLAAHARLAPRLLWNNAAVYADWALRRLATHADAPPEAARRALELVERPDWPGGGPNPFHAPVLHGADGAAVRRQCCLLYRLPEGRLCGNCPRPRKPARHPLDANATYLH